MKRTPPTNSKDYCPFPSSSSRSFPSFDLPTDRLFSFVEVIPYRSKIFFLSLGSRFKKGTKFLTHGSLLKLSLYRFNPSFILLHRSRSISIRGRLFHGCSRNVVTQRWNGTSTPELIWEGSSSSSSFSVGRLIFVRGDVYLPGRENEWLKLTMNRGGK